MGANKTGLEKERGRDWVLALPIVLTFVFLFVTFLPLSGWVSGVAGIVGSWINFATILLSSVASIGGLLAAYLGGKFLPRLFSSNRLER